MKKALYICIWELSKLFTDWRKSIVVFILPPILMFAALVLFPTLVNYLDTGSVSSSKITIVNSPNSFKEYYEENFQNYPFDVSYISEEKYSSIDIKDSKYKNYIFISFKEDNQIVIEYINSNTLANKSAQFTQDVLEPFCNNKSEINIYNVDSFNPVRKILDNRFFANIRGSTIIPQIIVLLMYYTIYSLSQDIFFGDKERGFLTKLKMAPVSLKAIIYGKMAAVVITSIVTAIVTFIILFLASWVNTSNDPMSLIPFGLWLMPTDLLLMLLIFVVSSIAIEFIVTLTIFSLEKAEDITLNLQLPLILILMEVFMLMVRDGSPLEIEYFIPIHNGIAILRDIIHAKVLSNYVWYYLLSSVITIVLCNLRLWKKRSLNGK